VDVKVHKLLKSESVGSESDKLYYWLLTLHEMDPIGEWISSLVGLETD